MKHLKTYKIYESLSEEDFKGDLMDICLDLTDTGKFKVDFIYFHISSNKSKCGIYIESTFDSKNPNYDGFKIDYNISEVILRIKDYLGHRYNGCSVSLIGRADRVEVLIYEDIIKILDEDTSNINNIIIFIK